VGFCWMGMGTGSRENKGENVRMGICLIDKYWVLVSMLSIVGSSADVTCPRFAFYPTSGFEVEAHTLTLELLGIRI